jgi:tetratricopeptide (TPR) repeat protein
VVDYSLALEHKRSDAQLWYGRGCAYAETAQWEKAAADYSKAIRLSPPTRRQLVEYALLCLAVNDTEEYRQACTALLELAGQVKDLDAAVTIARICTFAPDAAADLGPALRLAEMAVAKGPRTHHYLATLGAMLYRVGKFDAAIKRLTEAAKVSSGEAMSDEWLFLAMAHRRLGHAGEARRCLKRAVEGIEKETSWVSWDERLTYQILRREAEALIKPAHR